MRICEGESHGMYSYYFYEGKNTPSDKRLLFFWYCNNIFPSFLSLIVHDRGREASSLEKNITRKIKFEQKRTLTTKSVGLERNNSKEEKGAQVATHWQLVNVLLLYRKVGFVRAVLD